MECAEQKQEKLFDTVNAVKDASYKEKTNNTEALINSVLDHILDLKKILSDKAAQIEQLNERIEKITWSNEPFDETSLRMMNELIAAARDLCRMLKKNYEGFGVIGGTNYVTEETERFNEAVDDLRELAQDLESIYFNLPNQPGFTEITRQLTLL
ncbi:hypothetical protein SAMN05421747_10428 [Parapedobacter composti]|uniref:Uncharacterized protein n=1 Tax=Parapedobacter composti TaxID=623281 RepID=A0A1I1G8K2_9SPHI|nr:hypothetical protein [Parapedobacter composti]SFC07716.1 hypothetical protein SAMN05421747_10428 [Parapedobacter composti]